MAGPDLAGRRLGGFELVEPLGTGAFATVWRARQLRLGRDVAVKVLDPVVARNPDAARRFEREGRSAASLDHPHIVTVYEAGEEDDLVYLAMRLVEGETLEDLLDRESPLTVRRTADLLGPVADAIDHAHSRGLTHRDIKPSNILLGEARVWLADFGIAATAQEMGRYTTGALGTVEYMAPEQAAAGDIDHRADLYSLGCVVFHCLTGGPPFTGDEVMPVLMAHVNDDIPRVDHEGLAAFFDTALAKDPDDRFASASDLIDGLRDRGGVAPVTVVPPDAGGRTSSLTRPAVLVPLVLALVAVVVLAVVLSRGGDDESEATTTTVPASGDTSSAAAVDGATTANTAPVPTTPTTPDAGTETDATASTADPTTTTVTDDDGPLPIPGGLAVVATNDPLASLNPHTDFNTAGFLSGFVYPTLVNVEGDFSLTPNLAAELPELVTADPLTIRWTLRDDAAWNDGSPITSADVEATYEYLVSGTENLIGTYFYDQIEAFTVVSDTEFTVTFAEPIGAWRVLFSTTHPVIQQAAYQAHVDAGRPLTEFLQTEAPFAGGPYEVVGFEPERRISIRRSDTWWGEPVNLERVTFRTYASIDDQIDAVRTGDVDLTYVRLPAAGQVVEARSIDGVTVETGASDNQFELAFNTRRAPFDDVGVRQAIAHAIDRDALTAVLVQPVTGSAEVPLNSLLHYPRQPQYTEPFGRYGDLDEAARLLDEAGWIEGDDGIRTKDGEPLVVSIMYRGTTVDLINAEGQAQTIRDQLRRVGVVVQLEALGLDDYSARRTAGDFDARLDFTVINVDPSGSVLLRFGGGHCPPTVTGCDGDPIGFNYGGYANAEVDALIAQAETTADESARTALFQQIDALLAADVPTLPLYEGPAFVAHVSDLSGVELLSPRGGPLSSYGEWAYVAELD
ncbi:MAG: ABC transporter substrate-binding protein [Ilumatobacter sp.]|uniref:ABC transporter substrate-binding protein n=1 Tax=Ilumatobacter sp. TaxID=1967498 RepID=UPI00261D2B86|nr:ABC transporter substrate-binding protein [Ilumatobacter sp.]MDJ0768040.1 ABC transporter substrate-binding protein [Ilumatobacter sp.]